MAEFQDDTRVEASIEATVNTGDFNNLKPGYRVSTNVRPGEHPDAARARLHTLINRWISQDIDDIHRGN